MAKTNPAVNTGFSFIGRLGSDPMMLAPQFTGLTAAVRSMLSATAESFDEFLEGYCASWGDENPERKPFAFANGIAVIPVHGTLINRFGASWGYVTGYDYIRGALDAAIADSSVQGVMLDVDSYGGEVHGCFELSDHIYASRGKKPIMAMVNANCYSAAYATASAADSITVTPSGGAGSIGVVTMHVDYSKALEESGISVSFIFAGKHKVDGNPYEPLPESVRADIQSRIDATYEKFVATVARNRGISAASVRATQARTFGADDAKANGLIDSVSPPKAAFAAFVQALSGAPTNQEFAMSQENLEAGAETPVETPQGDGAALTAPSAETVTAPEAPTAAAPVAAEAPAVEEPKANAEKERIKAILAAPEAADRSALANHLALNTELSVDDALSVLAVSPKEAPQASGNAFASAMENTPNPEVGADGAAENAELKGAARILANYAKATGYSTH